MQKKQKLFEGNFGTPCMPNLDAFVVLIFISSDHHHYHTLRQFCSASRQESFFFSELKEIREHEVGIF